MTVRYETNDSHIMLIVFIAQYDMKESKHQSNANEDAWIVH